MAPLSAFIGQHPSNENDFKIVKGAIISLGLGSVMQPQDGLQLPGPMKPSPDQYHFDSNASRTLAACSVAIVCMTLATGTRLLIRFRNSKLRLGWDDLFITAGTVCIMAVCTGASYTENGTDVDA